MAVLDSILVNELIDTPTTVNTDFTTDAIDISNREDEFTVQIVWDNGSSVDMNVNLEVSSDGVNFASMSTVNITDAANNIIFDVVGGSGSRYARVYIEVIGGSIDVSRILYSGKRRH
jgi:hypothetical protein